MFMWLKTKKKIKISDQLEIAALSFRLLRKYGIHIAVLGSADSKEKKLLILSELAEAYSSDTDTKADVDRILQLALITDLNKKSFKKVWAVIIEPCIQYLYELSIIDQRDIANLAWIKTNWWDKQTWPQTPNKEQQ